MSTGGTGNFGIVFPAACHTCVIVHPSRRAARAFYANARYRK